MLAETGGHVQAGSGDDRAGRCRSPWLLPNSTLSDPGRYPAAAGPPSRPAGGR